jgi:hypothetical protein
MPIVVGFMCRMEVVIRLLIQPTFIIFLIFKE